MTITVCFLTSVIAARPKPPPGCRGSGGLGMRWLSLDSVLAWEGSDVCFYFRVTAAYIAPPTAPSTAGTAGLIEKLNSFNMLTIPRTITKAVRIEPAINFMKFDLM